MNYEFSGSTKKSILSAAAIYFVVVFGAGFLLGTLRVLFLAPRFGVRVSELAEMPVMLLVVYAGATWSMRLFRFSPTDWVGRLAVGAIALALMLMFEFEVVLKLRNLTLAQYFQERDPVSGTAYYLMLLVFALMPVFTGRRKLTRPDALQMNN